MDSLSRQLRQLSFRLGVLVSAGLSVGSALSSLAFAQSFSFDFTSAASFDRTNSTGLWNTLSGQLQAGVVAAATASKRLDFGDGSDGVFNDGPAQTGITIVGSTITFDTNEKALYQFTSFTLSAGMTVVATGSQPLQILVLGSASVAGTIGANGAEGTANQLSAGYPAGGAGGAGGGAGGQGGSPADAAGSTTGAAGTPASSPTRDSGDPGVNVATAFIQGGGGACHSAGTTASSAGSNNGASAGSCASSVATVADTLDTTFLGGAGGGGGGARVSTNISSGSGGGGGGGAIKLAVLGTLTLSGAMEARGGNGGATEAGATATTCGGGGGGGSGGALWVQTLTSGGLAGAGTVSVAGGTGGGSTVTCNGTDFPGGNGGSGIYRTDTPGGTQPWATTPGATAQNSTVAILTGQTYTVVSRALDLSRYYAKWSTPVETFRTTGTYCGAAGTTSVLYEGSSDGVNWVHPVAAASVAATLGSYPYLRFKVTFNTTGGTPPCLSALEIPLDASNLSVRGGFFFCAGVDARRTQSGPWTTAEVFAILVNGLLVVIGPLTIARRFGSSVGSAHRIQSSSQTS